MTPDPTTRKARKRHGRPFPWVCANCLAEAIYPEKTSYTAQVKHDGRLHKIQIPEIVMPKCRACGEPVFTIDVDDQIMAALRSHLNLLTPEQIKAGRKALGLKSKELAQRLGVADATVSRWEQKMMIQSRAMDNFLRVYFAVPQAREALRGPDQDPALGTPAGLNMEPEHAATNPRVPRNEARAMRKYQPLQEYLSASQHLGRVRMTFSEVAAVLGEQLPESAFKYREWWANQSDTTNRPQAAAWLDAGFVVDAVHQDREDGWVEFARQ